MDDSTRITGQKTNDPATMVLAVGRAQAIAQQNAAWINAGKVAEQTLPMLRNVIEALMYALFPILVLLLMLTGGRETLMALKGYISVLIWIQLWPPLYAVLNYMATIYAAYDLAAAADLGGGLKGLTLQTASTIYSRTLSGEAIVGYLVLSIPLIAWAAVKRMDHLGMALVGGLSGLHVDAAYGEAVTANRERAAVLTEAFSRGLATLKSGTQSSASSSTSLEGQGETLAQLDRISQGVSRATGLGQAQVANIAFGAAGNTAIRRGN
nr:conjugal transfer protein TraG N-terminal domain-containing protein [Pseudomonas carnis]